MQNNVSYFPTFMVIINTTFYQKFIMRMKIHTVIIVHYSIFTIKSPNRSLYPINRWFARWSSSLLKCSFTFFYICLTINQKWRYLIYFICNSFIFTIYENISNPNGNYEHVENCKVKSLLLMKNYLIIDWLSYCWRKRWWYVIYELWPVYENFCRHWCYIGS